MRGFKDNYKSLSVLLQGWKVQVEQAGKKELELILEYTELISM